MRLWGGRFGEENDARVADFTRSIEVDAELALDDLRGSVAHVRGLGRAGILTDDEVAMLVEGLDGLTRDVEAGTVEWDPSLEDVHMNVEAALVGRVGPVAGKLHTGRSRNDQIATDLRLWLRRAIDRLDAALLDMERALVELAERDGEAILPGMTHIQPAQPVFLAHHLLAYVEMLERDRSRLADTRRRANVSPLGSGALAGAGYPLDREGVAAELGFDGVTANSLDAVSDRDFVVDALAAAALGMVHLSRLGEEITWWSNPRFGFVRVADAFSTGSSMMPNKRNPDPAELVRGRTARVIGALTGGAWPAEGPAARLPARPPGGQAAAVRGGRDVGGVAWRDGRAHRHADRRSRPDARGRGRGLHDRDRRRRRARPPRRPVPDGPSRRRVARRPGGSGGAGPRRRPRRDDRAGAGGRRRRDGARRSPRSRASATRSGRPRPSRARSRRPMSSAERRRAG